MGLTHADIDDFVNTTLPLITKNKWEDISLPLQKYTFASRWFREREKPEEGGQYLTWTIQFADQTNARPSKIFETETTNRVRMTVPGRVDWTKQVNNYSYYVDEDNFQIGVVRRGCCQARPPGPRSNSVLGAAGDGNFARRRDSAGLDPR